jgi:hypothetical protein
MVGTSLSKEMLQLCAIGATGAYRVKGRDTPLVAKVVVEGEAMCCTAGKGDQGEFGLKGDAGIEQEHIPPPESTRCHSRQLGSRWGPCRWRGAG